MAKVKPIVVDDTAVQIPTEKPAKGSYRIVLALVDDHGTVKQTEWLMSAAALRLLPERYSWEQYVYPAIRRLMP